MKAWEVILDALTPGSPRHKGTVAALDRETARLDHLMAARAGGVILHPLDEISVSTHEITRGWYGSV